MLDDMLKDSNKAIERLEKLRDKLHKETEIFNPSSNSVIKTVALSNEISSEIKEILIILQTTIATEITESRVSNFAINLEIIDTARDVIKLQNNVIKTLAGSKNKKTNTMLSWSTIFKDYRIPISVCSIVLVIWVLTIIAPDATHATLTDLPNIIRGILK